MKRGPCGLNDRVVSVPLLLLPCAVAADGGGAMPCLQRDARSAPPGLECAQRMSTFPASRNLQVSQVPAQGECEACRSRKEAEQYPKSSRRSSKTVKRW